MSLHFRVEDGNGDDKGFNLSKICISSSMKNITIRDSCSKSGQIQSKFWPELDFQKRAGCRICRSRNPVHPYIISMTESGKYDLRECTLVNVTVDSVKKRLSNWNACKCFEIFKHVTRSLFRRLASSLEVKHWKPPLMWWTSPAWQFPWQIPVTECVVCYQRTNVSVKGSDKCLGVTT